GARAVAGCLPALVDRAGFQEPLSDAYVRPGDRLVNTLRRFTEERPAESLLVVLDEADRFVEAQLEEYEQRREDCLTFRMRTDVESIRDVQGLPRVRFVFAGYRVTQTSEGAWANWGRVLTLQPLSHDEGRALVEGPLARLGIDGSGQADVIAWRCGYQPAVLLRFGEQLLRRLERTRPASARARVEVNEEDVSTVFAEPAVQDEIRTIVRNNFRGNSLGQILFSALILEPADMPPATGLDDAPRRLLDRLRAIDSDVTWLRGDDQFALGEITRNLRDFVERQLLLEDPVDGNVLYQLRFPHHLSILLQQDQTAIIRQEIEGLRRGGQGTERHGAVRALVPRRVIRDVA